MKKIIALLFIFSQFYSNQNNTQSKKLPKFRSFDWNSNIEFVKENEEASYLQSFSGFGVFALSYKGKFENYSSRIDYTFKNDSLAECSYTIECGNFFEDFIKIRNSLITELGSPSFWAKSKIIFNNVWVKKNDFGTFYGPELYWQYDDGFVGMLSEKSTDGTTITIIYLHQQTIQDYGVQTVNPYDYIVE